MRPAAMRFTLLKGQVLGSWPALAKKIEQGVWKTGKAFRASTRAVVPDTWVLYIQLRVPKPECLIGNFHRLAAVELRIPVRNGSCIISVTFMRTINATAARV